MPRATYSPDDSSAFPSRDDGALVPGVLHGRGRGVHCVHARIPQGSTLLIDTYDTVEGARRAANVAGAVASQGGRVAGVRTPGDFLWLSALVRQVLDREGLRDVAIFASGSLDESEIARLLAQGAPIDGFGIGSKLGVSADAPYLDMAHKLPSTEA